MLKAVILLMRAVAFLPLSCLYIASDVLFFVVYYLTGYRKKVVFNNLTSSFPEKSEKEIKSIARGFYHFMCDIMVETIKLLSMSHKEIKRRVIVTNPDLINASLEKGISTVILLGHYGNWEWVQEIGEYFIESYRGSIYHRLKSKFWDDVFIALRGRWNMHIIPQEQAVRTLLEKSHQPWAFGFIADQRPREALKGNWTEFLNHETSFITGPEDIGQRVKADFFYLDIERFKRGYYRLTFKKLSPVNDGEPYPYMRAYLREFENTIRRAPSLWLWSHKRWKFDRAHYEAKRK